MMISETLNQPYSSIENSGYSNNFVQRSRMGVLPDAKLHLMAGASSSMGGAALVYIYAKWFSVKVKAAAIIVVGISAAVLFGAAKELYDSVSGGGVEWRDFWNTVLGGVGGATVSWAIFAVIQSPTIAGIVTGAAAAFVGYTPIVQLYEVVKKRNS